MGIVSLRSVLSARMSVDMVEWIVTYVDVREDPFGDIQRHTAKMLVADVSLPSVKERFSYGLTVILNLSIGAGCTQKLIVMFCSILYKATYSATWPIYWWPM